MAATVVYTLLAIAAGDGVATAAKKDAPANLLINAQEWSLWPSRSSVPAGTVYVELWNRGQDMHDTMIRRVNAAGQMVGQIDGRVKVTMPGHISDATWHLKAGHYELYCSMPGHLQLGMHAKLTVMRS
ncbi:MAG TPA: plastocyanin/azurin family copper-binding protein [Solirubrobacteraceae bacterium]|nr:plastocyanin/azurin family copper-binding protein [Solirubrobacteraceae bacterium]